MGIGVVPGPESTRADYHPILTRGDHFIRLEVRVPRFEIVVLERVAGREGKSVDAVLARELLDFVSVHSPWIGAEVAGFAEARQWPK